MLDAYPGRSLRLADGGSLKKGSGLRVDAPVEPARDTTVKKSVSSRFRPAAPIEGKGGVDEDGETQEPSKAARKDPQQSADPAEPAAPSTAPAKGKARSKAKPKPKVYSKPCNLLKDGQFIQDWVVIPRKNFEEDPSYIVAKRNMDQEDDSPLLGDDGEPVPYDSLSEEDWLSKVKAIREAQIERYKEINFKPVSDDEPQAELHKRFITDEAERLIPMFTSVNALFSEGAVQLSGTPKKLDQLWDTFTQATYAAIKTSLYGWVTSPFRSNNVTLAKQRYLDGMGSGKRDLNITLPNEWKKLMKQRDYDYFMKIAKRPPSEEKFPGTDEYVQKFYYDLELDTIAPRGWREQHAGTNPIPMPSAEDIQQLKLTFDITTEYFRGKYVKYYFLDPESDEHLDWVEDMKSITGEDNLNVDFDAEARRVIPGFNKFGLMILNEEDDPQNGIYKNFPPGATDNLVISAYEKNTREMPNLKETSTRLQYAKTRYNKWKSDPVSIDHLWPEKKEQPPTQKKSKKPKSPKDPSKKSKKRKKFPDIDQEEGSLQDRYIGAVERVGERRQFRRKSKLAKINSMKKKENEARVITEYEESWNREEQNLVAEENAVLDSLRNLRRGEIDAIEDEDARNAAKEDDIEKMRDVFPAVLLTEARKSYKESSAGTRGKARLEAQIMYLKSLSKELFALEDKWMRENRIKAIAKRKLSEQAKILDLTGEKLSAFEKKIMDNARQDAALEKEFYELLQMSAEERQERYSAKKQTAKADRKRVKKDYWEMSFEERVTYDDAQRNAYEARNPDKIGSRSSKTSFRYMRFKIDSVKSEQPPETRHEVYKEFYTELNGTEGRPGGRKRSKKRREEEQSDDSEDEDFDPEVQKKKDKAAKKARKKGKKVEEEEAVTLASEEAKRVGIVDAARRKEYERNLRVALQRTFRSEYELWKEQFEESLLSPEEKAEIKEMAENRAKAEKYSTMTAAEKEDVDIKDRDDELAEAEVQRQNAWQSVFSELKDITPADATESERFNLAWLLTKDYVLPIDKYSRDIWVTFYTAQKNWMQGWNSDYFIKKKDDTNQQWQTIMENRKIELVRDDKFGWSPALKKMKERLHKNAPVRKRFQQEMAALDKEIGAAKETGDDALVKTLRDKKTEVKKQSAEAYRAETYDGRVQEAVDSVVQNIYQLEVALEKFVRLILNGTEGSEFAVNEIVQQVKAKAYEVDIPTIEQVINTANASDLSSKLLTEEYLPKIKEVYAKEAQKEKEREEKRKITESRVAEDRAELDLFAAERETNEAEEIVVTAEGEDLGDFRDDFDTTTARDVRRRQRELAKRFETDEPTEMLVKEDVRGLYEQSNSKQQGQSFNQFVSAAFTRYNEYSNRVVADGGDKLPPASMETVLRFLINEQGSAFKRLSPREEMSKNTSGDYVMEYIRDRQGNMLYFKTDADGEEKTYSRKDAPKEARGKEVEHIKVLKKNIQPDIDENPDWQSVIFEIAVWKDYYFIRLADPSRSEELNKIVKDIDEKVKLSRGSFRTSDFQSDAQVKDYADKGYITVKGLAVTLNPPDGKSTEIYRLGFAKFLEFVRSNIVKKGSFANDEKQTDQNDAGEGELDSSTKFLEGKESDDDDSDDDAPDDTGKLVDVGASVDRLAKFGNSGGIGLNPHAAEEEYSDLSSGGESEDESDKDAADEEEPSGMEVETGGGTGDKPSEDVEMREKGKDKMSDEQSSSGSDEDSDEDSDEGSEDDGEGKMDEDQRGDDDDDDEPEAQTSSSDDSDSDDDDDDDEQNINLPGKGKKRPMDASAAILSKPVNGLASGSCWGQRPWWH
jgi:hypothetical protein